jgi:hypothetical protein
MSCGDARALATATNRASRFGSHGIESNPRACMGGPQRKNFFIAKERDSESPHDVSMRVPRLADAAALR